MTVCELNHVAIHVADVVASCAFYERVLCLRPMPRPAFDFPGAWFRLGLTQELHLIGERGEKVVSGNRSNHFALLVDDVEAWEKHLIKVGATFRPRKKRPDGAWQIFLADPDGHTIELCSPPT
ncbi:MAG: glyoxalase [Verrucomicrobia bacterium]|nr:glyoxalase [Verrucomicrobiota bacterium]